jgi:NhaP-type Na+/H+ or K+/H+ antiporter
VNWEGFGTSRGRRSRLVFALNTTWEFLGFCATSLIFLLIGIELYLPTLLTQMSSGATRATPPFALRSPLAT